jgi:thiamine biosynthesis lipoprotein ApbE
MDPATAQPRVTEMQSLSIVADAVMQADAATTALFGMTEAEITQSLGANLPGARLTRIL